MAHILDKQKENLSQKEIKTLIPKYKEYGLSPSELKFLGHYLTNGHNGTQAYQSAYSKKGYATSTAGVNACILLKSHKIQAALKDVFDDWLADKKNKLEKEIIDIYYRRAFYPLDVFYGDDGEMRSLSHIPRAWHCCIDGVERKYFGKDADRSTVVLKLSDKDKALSQLSKYITLFDDASSMNLNIPEESMKRLQDIFKAGQK